MLERNILWQGPQLWRWGHLDPRHKTSLKGFHTCDPIMPLGGINRALNAEIETGQLSPMWTATIHLTENCFSTWLKFFFLELPVCRQCCAAKLAPSVTKIKITFLSFTKIYELKFNNNKSIITTRDVTDLVADWVFLSTAASCSLIINAIRQ